MNKSFFIVGSVTYAIKGREILARRGIPAYIERTKKHKERYGCGYGLFVPRRTDEAEQILRDHEIRILDRTERDGQL